ncbi:hypothetical protein Q8A67_010603 [Cirrhinus molitorella]|uniref:SMB domain-containing protein n=1 Tax=Cirrhinus molitorella TaxID=172907 RepID=A0AA88PZV1_9TELE|nr:hypothetical protein Q8A67_010603 [Cirrhinus molitorella]
MAPAVLLIGCLLSTISCLTTAVINQTSNVTYIPVTTRPGVTNATTTTPVRGSCAGPDLCCSGFNISCFRLNCYCDVACLRHNDCCPDFKLTCLTVNNSTNSTNPNNTLTLTGTCSHPTLCCSGTNYNCFRGCFCDEICTLLNDCCPDFNSTCTFNSTTVTPPFTSTVTPPFDSTATPSITSTAPPLKVLIVLVMKVNIPLLKEEYPAVVLKVGTWVESYIKANNTGISSFRVLKFDPVSP